MLRSMAIRMKEWGLLAYPRQAVHLPLNALNDWGRTGRVLGQGVQEIGHGMAELAPAIQRVTQTGSKADAVAMLNEIGAETTEELLAVPVRDWDYSWKQSYTPRVQQMLNQFSGAEREHARKLSEEYGARFSLLGRRQMELQRIQDARTHWQKQLDSAVLSGDEEAACHWVEQGRDVFVPESEMSSRIDDARNKSLHAAWQNRLQQNPYSALAAWQNDEFRKPAQKEILQTLEADMQQTRKALFGKLALELASAVEQGSAPPAGMLERAAEVGILSPEQVELNKAEPVALSAADVCNWLRRIDERDVADDDKLTVDIALSPIPREQRLALLQRLRATGALPPQWRSAVSRSLWNLYCEGRFGCPGDAEAMLCLGRLQETALARMTSEPVEHTTRWLEQLRDDSEDWVCFENK